MFKIFIIGHLIISFWAVFSVIMHGVRASRSFGWLICILTLPIVGPTIYYLFGLNRRKFRFQAAKGKLKSRHHDEIKNKKNFSAIGEILEDGDYRLALGIYNSVNIAPCTGNKIKLLNTGKETFEEIFREMEKAEKFIHIQYYKFEKGELLERFYEILRRKISLGIEVRILYDSFGSSSFDGKLKKRFLDIGAKAYPMLPLRIWNFMYTLNYRNHRKIIVIDGTIGFIGGVNVSDKYIKARDELGIWADLHIRISGPSVNALHKVFIKDFSFASQEPEMTGDKYLPTSSNQGDSTLQIVASGPDSLYASILQQYLGMINLATKSIRICNPYFVPGQNVMNALVFAALSGIEVTLLVPKLSDSFMTRLSMYSNFDTLLRAGVKIYIRSDFSHSKVILIDDRIVSVGSGNFDYRSFEHNFEANALIYDIGIAEKISKEYIKEIDKAEQLKYDVHSKRSKIEKFWEGLARLFSPLL